MLRHRHLPIALLLVSTLSAFASASDPQTVYVVETSTHTRSGPSSDDYRTDSLSHGQSLTAFGETKDGWLAVQPPPGSFDWVPADAIEIQPGGQTGVVVEDKIRAWIGTHLGRARQYGYQVLLAKEEIVTILGKAQREGPEGPQTWYKIVPPSGEFRFVHRDEVVDSSEELIARVKSIGKRNEEHAAALEPAPVEELVAKAKSRRQERNDQSAVNDRELGPSVLTEASEARRRREIARADRDRDNAGNVSNEEPAETNGLMALLGAVRLRKAGSNKDQSATVGSGVAPLPRNEGTGTESSWTGSLPAFSPSGDFSLSQSSTNEVSPERLNETPVGQTSMLSGVSAMPPQNLTPVTSIVSLSTPQPIIPASATGTSNNVMPAGYSGRIGQPYASSTASISVSQTRLDSLTEQATAADSVGLQMMLSELMTRKSSSLETEILVNRLRQEVSTGKIDPSLLQRGERYLELARRRETSAPKVIFDRSFSAAPASTVADSFAAATVAPASASAAPIFSASTAADPNLVATEDHSTGEISVAGQLLKVYSARPGAPPFSRQLTDAGGRTLCYVTPMPGVNLRNYVNSHIEVVGFREQLAGLATSNVRVSSVVTR